MYKKILVTLILSLSLYCYSADDSSQITRLDVPSALLNLPKESKEAYLEALHKTTKVAGLFTNTLRKIAQEDSKAAADRLEKSIEVIAETISKRTTSTVIDVTRALGLQALFGWSVYYGYTIIKTDLLMGLFWITFGAIGLIHVQNILENIQKFGDSPITYIQSTFNKKQCKRFITKLMRKATKKKTNLDRFEEYIESLPGRLHGDDNNLTSLGLIRGNINPQIHNPSDSIQQNPVDFDEILDHALDEFDGQRAQ